MWINGFRADVYSDGWIAVLVNTVNWASVIAIQQRTDSIKASERAALCERADKEGFDKVLVQRHIHAGYDLRCTMSRRSGTLVKTIEARKNVNGVWFERKSSKSSFY